MNLELIIYHCKNRTVVKIKRQWICYCRDTLGKAVLLLKQKHWLPTTDFIISICLSKIQILN